MIADVFLHRFRSCRHGFRGRFGKQTITLLLIMCLGLSLAIAQDYSMDSDYDGFSDGEEMDGGYDPYDPNNYPGYEYSVDPTMNDSDNDGYSDDEETNSGSDPYDSTSYPGSSSADPTMNDSDNDGYSDDEEMSSGSDPNDPTSYPGMTDPDSDGDGYPDSEELAAGTNEYDSASYPGGPDPSDPTDSDEDGYSDEDEGMYGSDPYDPTSYPGSENIDDPTTTDTDGDGLFDADESSFGTDPGNVDSDNDGIDDYAELFGVEVWLTSWNETTQSNDTYAVNYTTDPLNPDSDGDLLNDGWEITNAFDPNSSLDGDADPDEDGLSTGAEISEHSTDPNNADSDIDGENDGYEVTQGTDPNVQTSRTSLDGDGDVMSDDWETTHGFDPANATDAPLDFDLDGLSNLREYLLDCDPGDTDTDDDTYLDGFEWDNGFDPSDPSDATTDSDDDTMPDLWEITYGLDPFVKDDNEDFEGDGLLNYEEYLANLDPSIPDTDGDGTSDYNEVYGPDPYTIDTDGDSLSDGQEATLGTDPNLADTDGDDLDDNVEVNGFEIWLTVDGVTSVSPTTVFTNPLEEDSDQDLMPDGFEAINGFNPNDSSDGQADDDGDTLSNGVEVSQTGTDWKNADSDDDGVSDGLEITQQTDPLDPTSSSLDLDGDLMRDSWETTHGLDPNDPSDGSGNLDDDTLTNLEEFQAETNPHNPDSDGDSYWDDFELANGKNPADPADATDDGDGDGMPDLWEVTYGLDRTSDADENADLDSDGLLNAAEYTAGTLPNNTDTDADGLSDATEVTMDYASIYQRSEPSFTSPVDADTDNDLIPDGIEVAESQFNPFDPADGLADADADNLSNGEEISQYLTDWSEADTDLDGEDDGYEITQETNPLDRISRTSLDSDGDHMSDDWENANGLNAAVADGTDDPDNDQFSNYGEYLAKTDPFDADSDNDTYADGFEHANGKDPLDPADAADDSDGDGMPDLWEIAYGLLPNDASDAAEDLDNDNLTNLTEFESTTDPTEADTDNDGQNDDVELANGTSPTDENSFYVADTTTTSNADGSTTATTTHIDGSNTAITTSADTSTVTTVITRNDGSTTTTSTTTNVDGSTVTTNTNGSVTTTGTDGTISTANTDGTTLTTYTDGTLVTTNIDGTTVTTQTDGTLVTTNIDGTTSSIHTDGTIVNTNLDGSTTTINLDGTTTTTVPPVDDNTGAEHLIAAFMRPEDRPAYISPLTAAEDADRDGMLDTWETQHGLNPEDSQDAWQDFDYDRIINRTEYELGTIPNTDWTYVAIQGDVPWSLQTQQWAGTNALAGYQTLRGDGSILSVTPDSSVFTVKKWSGNWANHGDLGPVGDFDEVTQIVANETGLVAAVVVKQSTSGGYLVEVRIRDKSGNLTRIGENEGWSGVSSLWVTESGFVAGTAHSVVGPFSFRWREGVLETYDSDFTANGFSERGEFTDRSKGILQGTQWTDQEAYVEAIGPYGKVWTTPLPPNPDSWEHFLQSPEVFLLNRRGDRLKGYLKLPGGYSFDENSTGFPWGLNATFRGSPLYTNPLFPVNEPIYEPEPENLAEGESFRISDMGSFDGTYFVEIYTTDGSGNQEVTSSYTVDLDYDDDGWLDEAETSAGTDPYDPSSYPGFDDPNGIFAIFISGMNDLGDVIGYRKSKEPVYLNPNDSASNFAEFPDDGYLWRTRDFSLMGLGDESRFWAINNSGHILVTRTTYEPEIDYYDSNADGIQDPDEPSFETGNETRHTTWGMLFPQNEGANVVEEDKNGLPGDWELMFGVSDPDGDPDQDTLSNRLEYILGTHPRTGDTDGDGIKDHIEIQIGSNPLNYQDGEQDNDFDGLSNVLEISLGSDVLSSDTDQDGMPDGWEYNNAANTNLLVADADADPDADGFSNLAEYTLGLGVFQGDSDGDGMADEWEQRYSPPLDATVNDANGNPDGDALSNYLEFIARTDPTVAQLDSDLDGMPDDWELAHGFEVALNTDALWDFDGDGLTNLQEYFFRTDPKDPDTNNDGIIDSLPRPETYDLDTDQDGMPNGYEAEMGFVYLDPRDASADFDEDGRTNYEEFLMNTNPKSPLLFEVTELGPDGFWGTALSDTGQISGIYRNASDELRDFTWTSGTLTDVGSSNGGIPPSPSGSLASEIIFRGRPLPITGLGSAPSDPAVVDFDEGSVVAIGRAVDELARTRPYLWRKNQIWDLDQLVPDRYGWFISDVIAINPLGQVLARGLQNGREGLLLLTPELDVDGDGMADAWELQKNLSPFSEADADSNEDNDELTAYQEYQIGTDPGDDDTDDDGITDGREVHFGLNPLNHSDATLDHDHDLVSNIDEIAQGTSPHGTWQIVRASSLTGNQIEVLGLSFENALIGRSKSEPTTWQNWIWNEDGTAQAPARLFGDFQGNSFFPNHIGGNHLVVGKAGDRAMFSRDGYLLSLFVPGESVVSSLFKVNRSGVASGYYEDPGGMSHLFRYNLLNPRLNIINSSSDAFTGQDHVLASSGSIVTRVVDQLTRFRTDGSEDNLTPPDSSILGASLTPQEWSDFGRILFSGEDHNQDSRHFLYSFETSAWEDLSVSSNPTVHGRIDIAETNGAMMLVGNSDGSPFLKREEWSSDYGTIGLNGLLSETERDNWQILTADAVNDQGVIAGLAINEGQLVPYLLRPDRDLNGDGTIDASEQQYFGDFSNHLGVTPDQGVIGGDGTERPGTIPGGGGSGVSTVTSLTVIQGNNQSITGTTGELPQPIVVEALNTAGIPVSGSNLIIRAVDGGGVKATVDTEFDSSIQLETNTSGQATFNVHQ